MVFKSIVVGKVSDFCYKLDLPCLFSKELKKVFSTQFCTRQWRKEFYGQVAQHRKDVSKCGEH